MERNMIHGKKALLGEEDKKRVWLFGLRVFFLCVLCILPSYELVRTRLTNRVSMQGMECDVLELADNSSFEQEIEVGKATHIKELAVGIQAALDNENASIVITAERGDRTCSQRFMQSEIPVDGFLALSDADTLAAGDAILRISVEAENLYGGSVALKIVPEKIYGYGQVYRDKVAQEGSVVLSMSGWSMENEGVWYSIAWIAVIFLLVVLSSWLITWKKETVWFDKTIRATVFLLIIAVFSLLYPSFLWYGCDWCEGIFYYRKIQENSLLRVLASSDFNLYMAQFNNIFMYLFVKILGIDTYTFVACQILSIGMVAYWGTLFCKKQYDAWFSIDFRVGAAVVAVCYLYTMQEFSFIGIAYFGILFLLYLITYDFSNDRLAFWISLPVVVILCLSKMTFVLFCPIGLFLLFLWRKKLSKRNRILLWTMSLSCLAEGAVSVLLNGGLSGGNSLGTIQHISLGKLLYGSLYYALQLANSVYLHGMQFSNALLVNVLMLVILMSLLIWCIWEIRMAGRYEKAAGFLTAMLAVVYGNCMLQLLANSYSMTADRIHFDQIFYIPVEDKWWWYSFGYVALWAVGLTCLYILTSFLRENAWMTQVENRMWYRGGCIAVAFLICILTVNQYAYHEDDLQGYKTANMFTVPSMMQGNFTEYSFMQKDEKFLIVTSSKPQGLDWFYPHNVSYFTTDLERETAVLDFGEEGLGIGSEIQIPSLYVHKCEKTNQWKDGAYIVRLYDAKGNELAAYRQLDSDLRREYICFYFDGNMIGSIAYVTFEYEDGTPAYIDGSVRMGYLEE